LRDRDGGNSCALAVGWLFFVRVSGVGWYFGQILSDGFSRLVIGENLAFTEHDYTLAETLDRGKIVADKPIGQTSREEVTALITGALAGGVVGEYQMQAMIAAVHDEAASVEDTDWQQILTLYGLLERMTGNPMVALNRAIAAAMVHGPAAGLKLLEPLDEPLGGHYRLDAVRAHLYEMAGDTQAAMAHYRAAAARTTSIPEQQYLTTQAARLRAGTAQPGGPAARPAT